MPRADRSEDKAPNKRGGCGITDVLLQSRRFVDHELSLDNAERQDWQNGFFNPRIYPRGFEGV